jgi:Flp pilus assembly protein TadG
MEQITDRRPQNQIGTTLALRRDGFSQRRFTMRPLRFGARCGRVRSERGVELIEFAISLPVLLLILAGIIDFGFLFQRYEVVTNAAREGARVKSVASASTTADIGARVSAYLTDAGLNPALASTSVNPVAIPINPAGTVTASGNQVVVQYPYQFRVLSPISGFFGGSFGTVTLTASSMMRTL